MRRHLIIVLMATAMLSSTASGLQAQYIPEYKPYVPYEEMKKLVPYIQDRLKLVTSLPPRVYINEIMVNVGMDISYREDAGEYVELYNWGTNPVEISQWRISGDQIVDYDDGIGLPGTLIPARGYALIVDPDTDMWGDYRDLITNDDRSNFIIVTVDDDAIGDGLNNEGGVVNIITNWRKYRGGFHNIRVTYPNQAGGDYDGTSYEVCGIEYYSEGIPSPCSQNICD